MLDVLLEVILPVVAVAAIGGLVGQRLGFDLDTLSRATFFLFSPALVFVGLSTVHVEGSAIARIAGVCAGVFVLNAVIAFAWSRHRGVTPAERASIAMSSAVPNQGNMGLPMARLAYGAAGLELGTVLFVIGVILNASAAVALGHVALHEHTRGRALLAPLRYPTIYAAAAGIAVNLGEIQLPTVLGESVSTLAQASIPVMLVVLGLSFRLPRLGDLHDPIFVSVNRLVFGPLLAWGLCLAMGLDGTVRDVTILMAGMPAAVNTTILAAQLRADVGLAVRVVVVSTLCSIVSLTALLTIL